MPDMTLADLASMSFHVFLLLVVVLMYRRQLVLERALAECLQSNGQVKDTTLDTLQKP
jgi:hypothetical protein